MAAKELVEYLLEQVAPKDLWAAAKKEFPRLTGEAYLRALHESRNENAPGAIALFEKRNETAERPPKRPRPEGDDWCELEACAERLDNYKRAYSTQTMDLLATQRELIDTQKELIKFQAKYIAKLESAGYVATGAMTSHGILELGVLADQLGRTRADPCVIPRWSASRSCPSPIS